MSDREGAGGTLLALTSSETVHLFVFPIDRLRTALGILLFTLFLEQEVRKFSRSLYLAPAHLFSVHKEDRQKTA